MWIIDKLQQIYIHFSNFHKNTKKPTLNQPIISNNNAPTPKTPPLPRYPHTSPFI